MNAPEYVIVSPRLGLRRLTAEDASALAPVFADDYAAKFYPAMRDPAAIDKWIAGTLRRYETQGIGLWAVELLEGGTFIGDAGITTQSIEGGQRFEIGYHVHPDHRGKGYATEAANACLHHGFSNLQMPAICSIVHPANIASQKVASKVHASMRRFEWHSGPHLLYSTTLDEYRARR